MNPALAIVAVLLAAVSSCDQMRHQPRYDSEERSTLFRNGQSLQAPPDNTIARDDPAYRRALRERPAMTDALLARGRERFGIYCTPCHDLSGSGQGIVPSRGFPHPPSFHIDRLRNAPSSYFVDVITNGHGVMYSYADRVSPADRWAIAAYIRALQLSQNAPASALSQADRAKLDGGKR
jgi:mono/diheme cytochrome c family protein